MRCRSCCRRWLSPDSLSGSGACSRRFMSSCCGSSAAVGCSRPAAAEPSATGLHSRGSGSISCTASPCCSPTSGSGSGGGGSASCWCACCACCAAAWPVACWPACCRCCWCRLLRRLACAPLVGAAMPLAVAPASATARAVSAAPPRNSSRRTFRTARLAWLPACCAATCSAAYASAAAAGCTHRHACMLPLLLSLLGAGHSSSCAGQMAPQGN